jgi:Fic family protein
MSNYEITDEQVIQFIRESNAIEEIHNTYEEVEAAWKKKKSKIPEMDGHVKAFHEMVNWMFSENFTEIKPENISKLHTTLMKDLLEPYELGFRREWVRVGSRLCPPPLAVSPMLKQWCEKVNKMEYPTEEEVWQAHLAYETIHPFIDGNGRSGRLIWLWLRYKHGFGYACIINKTKYTEYYPHFDPFSWDEWISQK